MRKSPVPTASVLILYASVIFLVPACRPTPVSPPSSESAPEARKGDPVQPDTPAPAAPPESAKPQKELLARHLPESRIAAPDKDPATRRIEYNTVLNNRPGEPLRNSAWQYRSTRQGQLVVGFEFSNHGGNRILPPRRDPVKNQFFARDFQFRFDERARQDIHLMITDWAPSRDRAFRLSELMNSLMLFFPRTFLPAIVNSKNRNIVTLPTGEEVEFDARTHEIMAGVLAETPVDLNPDRSARKFPGIEYNGKGIALRANARGADPRVGTTTLITTGTPAKDCDKGILCSQCEVKSQDLWDQSGAARFKYATDADFDRFLVARCGFGLPRIGSDFAIAAPANNR